MATNLGPKLLQFLRLTGEISKPESGKVYETPSGVQIGSNVLLSGTRGPNGDGSLTLSGDGAGAVEKAPGVKVSPYRTSGERRTFIRNGVVVNDFASRSQVHDIFGSSSSLTNPLTGMSNIGYLNIGRPLVAIPEASSAPYWTDPGALTYTYDAMPASVPGQIDFVNGVCRVRVPAGYGDGAGGRRRTQMNLEPLSARTRVRWDLRLQIPMTDEGVYDVSETDGMLLWQVKTSNAEPVMQLSTKPNADGTISLFFNHKWSAQVGDTATYRSQHNNNSAGVISAGAGRTLFSKNVEKGRWYDVVIEAYLDERDLAFPSNGQGYVDVWVDNEQVLAFSGPTLSIRGASGAVPTTSVWTIGAYCYQSAFLDLNSPTAPAPRNREVWYSRARMFMLEKSPPVNEPIRLLGVAANASFTLPAGHAITRISGVAKNANAVTGGINVATTSGASDAQVLSAQTLTGVAGGTDVFSVQPLTSAVSLTDRTIYIKAVTAWNSASVDLLIETASVGGY